jgi:prepilin-type N-terminal cleavage/methylation domain-containing protein
MIHYNRQPATYKLPRGFTLLELIVSVAIFAIVMLLASGAYYTLIALARDARATTSAMNTLYFAVEDMTRAIRTGSQYCVEGCFSSSFSFVDDAGNTVTYSKSGTALNRKLAGSGGTTNGTITDPEVLITKLDFSVADPTAFPQPRVRIIMQGTVATGPGKTQTFSLQTSATERALESGNGL